MKRYTILFAFILTTFMSATTYAATSSTSDIASQSRLNKIEANTPADYDCLQIILDSVVAINATTSKAYFGYRSTSERVIYIDQSTPGSEAYTYNIISVVSSINHALFYLQYFYPGEHHVLYGDEFPLYSGQKMTATFPSTKEIVWTLGNSSMTVDQFGEVVRLPVQMNSFVAILQGTSAVLQWSTTTETNNAGFQIERSIEGSSAWISVTFIPGAGTSNAPKSYIYEDKNLAPGSYIYRMKQIDNDGTTTLYDPTPKVDAGKSNSLQLCGNYPNPFNPSTEIRFSVPQDGYASLKVYNIIGQEVATLFDGFAKAGHYLSATFNASRLASGVYFSRLHYNGKSMVQRMVLTK
jgi:hypothetical protein